MTDPTISHTHGHLEDCLSIADWHEKRLNMLNADADLSLEAPGIWKIEAKFDDGATNEYVFYEKPLETPISTTTYSKYKLGFKTSHSAAGAKASVQFGFISDVTGAVADDGGVQTDETTEATNSTIDDMTLLPAVPAVNDAYYFGGDATFYAIILNISTTGAGNTLAWEYWDGGAWAALPGVGDGTVNFTESGKNSVTFSVPGDWATCAVGGIANKYWIRARVTVAGAQAKGAQVWTVDSFQTIMEYGEYSEGADWEVKDGTVTTGKTLGLLRFYADDDGTDGTFYVYYDFLLIYKGTFTPPQWDNCYLLMESYDADMGSSGRVSDITQYHGMPSPIIHLDGPMDNDADWGTPDGEYLLKIHLRRFTEPWQWLTSDVFNGKVTSRRLQIGQHKTSGMQRLWSWSLKLYSASSGSETVWGNELKWLGL